MRVKPPQRQEQGAVAVMFALMVTGLLGIGVLMVDVGALYVEGRQLQNGAENAALAVARTCVTTVCEPGAGDDLANANALDNFSQVEIVCRPGDLPADLPLCPSSGERERFGCGPVRSTDASVQVHTRSLRSDGTNVVPAFLMRVLDPAYQGTSVSACARASYGIPASLTGELPLAISVCEFEYWYNLYGLVSAPYPPEAEAILYFHQNGDEGASDCPARNTANNMDSPGGFGWLTTEDGTCETDTTLSGDATVNQGDDIPQDCDAEDFAAMWQQVVKIPVYTSMYEDPDTGKTTYDIVNYAAFYLSGYKFGGNPAYRRASSTLGRVPCSGSDNCISGFFTTEPVTTTGALVSGTSYGSVAIKVTG